MILAYLYNLFPPEKKKKAKCQNLSKSPLMCFRDRARQMGKKRISCCMIQDKVGAHQRVWVDQTYFHALPWTWKTRLRGVLKPEGVFLLPSPISHLADIRISKREGERLVKLRSPSKAHPARKAEEVTLFEIK